MDIRKEVQATANMQMSKKVILNVLFAHNIIVERLNAILKPLDISAEQFNVLRILRGQKNKAINMTSIQERMIARNSNTTRLVDKLLLKNYVSRATCASNRRVIEIRILQEGLDVLELLDPLIIAHEQEFSQNLSLEELNQLNTLLEKYRNV